MKRALFFLWFFAKPSLVWSLRTVFWIVTAPIGALLWLPRVSGDVRTDECWYPIALMSWLERGPIRKRIEASRKAADEAVARACRDDGLSDKDTLLRMVGKD